MVEKRSADYLTGDNWVRNETDPREFEFVVNGMDTTTAARKIEILPLECISGVCELELVEDVQLEDG